MLNASNICIVRLGALGDVINTLPALDALRAACPEARISWLVEAPWHHVLPGPPRLDEVIVLPKREWVAKLKGLRTITQLPSEVSAFAKDLRSREFDLVVDFHGNLRSGIATFFTGAKVRAGFAAKDGKEFNHLFINQRHAVNGAGVHRVDRALALAEAVGAGRRTDVPRLKVRDDDLAFARKVFEQEALSARPVVTVHPGTSRFGRYKQWPADRYAEVIAVLEERGFAALVTWGPDEYPLAVTAATGTGAVIAPPTKHAGQLAGLLSLCDAFLGADSGPAVLAAAVDTPPVVLFGPKDPTVYAPRHPRTRVVEIPMDCRPCRKRSCRNPKCVLHITVRHVADAAIALLSEMEGN